MQRMRKILNSQPEEKRVVSQCYSSLARLAIKVSSGHFFCPNEQFHQCDLPRNVYCFSAEYEEKLNSKNEQADSGVQLTVA